MIRQLLQLTTPIGMGYLPTGFAFGVLAIEAGLSPLLTVSMSIFIFAGALQFASVPLLVTGAGVSTLAVTTLLINLRHILYAIPLLEQLPRSRAARSYVIATLTDENYSVLTTLPKNNLHHLAPWISFVNHGYWILGTILGVVLGAQVSGFIPNLGFALPALFTILAIEQYLSRRRWFPAVIGSGAYAAAYFILPSHVLITSLLFGLIALIVLGAKANP